MTISELETISPASYFHDVRDQLKHHIHGIGSFEKLVRSRSYDTLDIKSVLLHEVLQHLDLPDLVAMKKNC